jgi:hypothetical protein
VASFYPAAAGSRQRRKFILTVFKNTPLIQLLQDEKWQRADRFSYCIVRKKKKSANYGVNHNPQPYISTYIIECVAQKITDVIEKGRVGSFTPPFPIK